MCDMISLITLLKKFQIEHVCTVNKSSFLLLKHKDGNIPATIDDDFEYLRATEANHSSPAQIYLSYHFLDFSFHPSAINGHILEEPIIVDLF